MENNDKLHALLMPLPLQGHVIPFIHLAMKLASHGVTVTFVNTQSIDHLIVESNSQNTAGDIFAGARDSGLDIRYTTISDGSPLDFDRSLHHDQFFERFLEVVTDRVDELVGKLVEEDGGQTVNCLIADTFYAWPSVIAEKHGLVNVSFWTETLLVFTLYYHWDLIRSHSHCGTQGNEEVEIDYVPGVASIKRKDLMSYIKLDDITSVIARAIRDDFEHVNKVDLIITNTVAELEPEPLAALKKMWPVYTIGPILPPGFTKGSIATSMWSESDCTQWLNTKPKGSVLYVSFGSWVPTSHSAIIELAHGLLLSGVRFVWVLRPHTVFISDKTDLLPIGFDDQVKGQGLVVPWCCQVDVISHHAIGGFLTHCGWNSILESIWCNVPMLCYPRVADQQTNRKLVVDDWQCGINLCDGKSITRVEVATKINRLMNGKSAEELKERVRETRNKLATAWESTGSSQNNLIKFINDVKGRILRRSYE